MAATLTYQYSVRDRAGKVVTGTIDADSPAAVATKLKSMGYAPLSINEQSTKGMSMELNLPKLGPKVKMKDLAVMSRQFATMINAGLSLLRALNSLSEQTENPVLAEVLTEVRNDVETGQALSAAFAKHPDIFPPLMINMTRAGEVGGFLDRVMMQIAENYEAEVRLKGKIKAAMTYPVVVFCMAILAVVGMLIFIVPVFSKMFLSLGGELPTPTKVLVAMWTIVRYGGPFFLVDAIAGFYAWHNIKHKEEVRSFVDPGKLKIPVFGSLFQKIALARFARNLGTMMQSGVPILQSLEIVADTTGNMVLANAIRDVQDSVRQGE